MRVNALAAKASTPVIRPSALVNLIFVLWWSMSFNANLPFFSCSMKECKWLENQLSLLDSAFALVNLGEEIVKKRWCTHLMFLYQSISCPMSFAWWLKGFGKSWFFIQNSETCHVQLSTNCLRETALLEWLFKGPKLNPSKMEQIYIISWWAAMFSVIKALL